MIPTNTKEKIAAYTKELRLPAIRNNYSAHARQAVKDKTGYEEYLLALLEDEFESRIKNRKSARIRQADFPYKKYLHDLQREELPKNAQAKIDVLQSLEFIKEGRNVILAGNPGTGKTHLSIGLGIKACMEDYKVFFTTVPRLITQIRECRSQKTLRTLEGRFEKFDLVICDEFGYISFERMEQRCSSATSHSGQVEDQPS
jgi:DNA replication protein DnaC